MPSSGPYKVTIPASVTRSLSSLGPDDARRVIALCQTLAQWNTDDFIRSHSQVVDIERNIYLLRTSTEVRIFFTFQDDAIVILDVARADSLAAFGGPGQREAE